MPNNDSKTYILDDQWTDKDALDFTSPLLLAIQIFSLSRL